MVTSLLWPHWATCIVFLPRGSAVGNGPSRAATRREDGSPGKLLLPSSYSLSMSSGHLLSNHPPISHFSPKWDPSSLSPHKFLGPTNLPLVSSAPPGWFWDKGPASLLVTSSGSWMVPSTCWSSVPALFLIYLHTFASLLYGHIAQNKTKTRKNPFLKLKTIRIVWASYKDQNQVWKAKKALSPADPCQKSFSHPSYCYSPVPSSPRQFPSDSSCLELLQD